MALTYTPAPKLGSPCPDFRLTAVDGRIVSLADLKKPKALVVMFICGHCPYVQAIENRIVDLAKSYKPAEVAFVGICSNDFADYPEDRPEALLKRTRDKGYTFPYLVDENQTVARAFGAVCTPDIFVYDGEHRLAYRGRFDDSWKNPALVKNQELKSAIDLLMNGNRPSHEQVPSMGCSIKWKGLGH